MDAERIFHKAIDIPDPNERAAYLDRICKDDDGLRSAVEALLHADQAVGDFLESPALGADATLAPPSPSEGPGTKIGNYELIEVIGEGGMGLVYLAQQQEPKRRVALKIVKLGMDTKQVVARFEAERQVLAVLEHPNIAHVFDAGTTDTGRPYFVMEYVEGRSITKYCDEQTLSVEKRLGLFQQVCEGVHHAHQKGIIHRDIKPSNILVSVHGDRAVPKIIDFGIAKAITQPLTENTPFTEQGQLLGTPEYMSPEQAEMAYQDVDTRSDIYSLGVLLYELLAGATPFDAKRLRKGGIDRIQQVICQEEPRTPSARLTSLGDKAKTVAERHRTQIVTLTRRLHRELEWIPMKAMRKDRNRRYRSASELSDDIQNYLNGTPLIAGPESNAYRARKFVHKHVGFVASAALVAVVIVLGLITSTAFSISAEKARSEEAAARVEAEQAREQEVVARTQAEEAHDKEAALRAQVEQALARAEKAEKAEKEQRKLAEEQAEDLRRALYAAHLSIAKEAYGQRNIRRVRELLESCPVDLRGWEWYRLRHIADQSHMTLHGHDAAIKSIAFSPDGKCIVSACGDKTIKVWDAATGAELTTLRGHEGGVRSAAFSPDGMRIVSGSVDKTIKVWDAATGAELMTLKGHEKSIESVAFSPDGRRIASASDDKTVKVWHAVTGAELMTLRGHNGWVYFVSFSPDGKRIVSGSSDWTVKVWDAATGTELTTLRGHWGEVLSVAFSSDGKRVVSGGEGATVKVWDVAAGKELMTLSGHKVWIESVAFSPDGKRIVSGGADNTIKVWDAATGAELMTLVGHDEFVCSAVFSPDGKHIVSGSGDATIKVWDAAIRGDVVTLSGHRDMVNGVAFSPDGKRIASGAADATVKLWDVVTGAELMTLSGHHARIWAVAFSPDGERIVSCSGDKTVKVWNSATGAELTTLRGHWREVYSVAFSPDGKRIVSGSWDRTAKVWDSATGAELVTLRGRWAKFGPVSFSPDGKRIVSGSGDGTVSVWDADSGAELLVLRGHKKHVDSVAFSPDGKRIVSASYDRTIKVWGSATGAELMTLRGHGSIVRSAAFSPDGKRIVSASEDGTVKVWDSATGTELMTLPPPAGNKRVLRSLAISPCGETIADGGTGGSIRIWESAAPAGGYEPRWNAEVARKAVDQLYEEHGFYSEVINKLKADKRLDESVRETALQIANSRLREGIRRVATKVVDELYEETGSYGEVIERLKTDKTLDEAAREKALQVAKFRGLEEATKLGRESWAVVRSPGRTIEEYRWALGKAEMANRLQPSDDIILNLNMLGLGAAQYRVRAYQDALTTLIQCGSRPAPLAFMAMVLYQLGHVEQAQATLNQLRVLYENAEFAEGRWGRRAQPFAIEAEKLFAGENTKLYSVWEHIEEGELEEAAQLIEELRTSKDAETTARIEGAVKWLGWVYSSVTTVPVMGGNSTDDTTVSDLAEFQGTWVGTVPGKEGRGEVKVKWTFSGNSFHYVQHGLWFKGTFILNEELVPKQVDLAIKESSWARLVGRTRKNIYELKNERLILAASQIFDKTRRSDFEPSAPGRVFQLKRQASYEE